MNKSRYVPARRALLFWCLFIGVGAVAGALGMLCDPSGKAMGMDATLPYFQVLPFSNILFRDFTFSGVALLTVNGITNLWAALLILFRKKLGIILGTVFGLTLMLWICIQFYIFPLNFMSTIYFIFGLIQLITGHAALIFLKQEAFHFNADEYPNVCSNSRELVVFFSRMGYTKKLAYERANETGADIYEIKAKEKTDGTAGFWWCGRFGMHRWFMPIEDIDVSLAAYDKVTICSPIWVFSLSAPVREFCKMSKGKVKRVGYILCHHMKRDFKNAASEADSLLGIEHEELTTVCFRKGKYVSQNKYGKEAAHR